MQKKPHWKTTQNHRPRIPTTFSKGIELQSRTLHRKLKKYLKNGRWHDWIPIFQKSRNSYFPLSAAWKLFWQEAKAVKIHAFECFEIDETWRGRKISVNSYSDTFSTYKSLICSNSSSRKKGRDGEEWMNFSRGWIFMMKRVYSWIFDFLVQQGNYIRCLMKNIIEWNTKLRFVNWVWIRFAANFKSKQSSSTYSQVR